MIRPPILPDLRVILADPDEYTRRSTREILRGARLTQIAEVSAGVDLPRRLANLGPSLVILDVELPGFDLPELHRSIVEGGHLLIITARRITPDLAVAARRVAPGGILAKPFPPTRLWLRLATLNRVALATQAIAQGSANPAMTRGVRGRALGSAQSGRTTGAA